MATTSSSSHSNEVREEGGGGVGCEERGVVSVRVVRVGLVKREEKHFTMNGRK